MSESKGNKSRLPINLSIFGPNTNDQIAKSAAKSPRNFEEPNGVVGLGIVAALSDSDPTHDPFLSSKPSRAAVLAISPRSNPIPILSKTFNSGSKFGGPNLGVAEDMDFSEEYTCVISHIGNNLIKKEYFDGGLGNDSEKITNYWGNTVVVSASSPPASVPGQAGGGDTVFQTADFLDSCYLCKKQLHGLDIFMYRGEKAFCSAECRYKQIKIDERKEKRGSETLKPLECSVSPCSGPMQFLAGLAAA